MDCGAAAQAEGSVSTHQIPDAPRSLIKAFIVSLAQAGLIAYSDADNLIALLGLGDA